jgi:low affinity Fe/Cu permease
MADKQDFFTQIATKISALLGRAWVFSAAVLVLVVWGLSGPLLKFSDTWQLIINTSTTIITFLMVFVIQNTQNRDNMAINLKLDALMEKSKVSEEDWVGAEDLSDKILEKRKEAIEKRDKKSKTRRSSKSRK